MRSTSDDAMSVPPRRLIDARGEHRRDVQREGAGDRAVGAVGQRADVEQVLLEHVAGAVVALLAGLEHEHAPGRPARRGGRRAAGRRRPAWRRGCRGRRRASCRRSADANVEAGVLGHRQGVHVAAQQDGRAGPAAVERGHDRRRRLAGAARRRAARRGRPAPASWVNGQVEADLGALVEPPAQAHRLGKQVAGLEQQGVIGHVRAC